MSGCSKSLFVCVKGKACSKRDSDDLLKWLNKAITKLGLKDFYTVKRAECFGLCKSGPIVMVDPDGCKYGLVTKGDCKDIVKRHVKRKKPIKRLTVNKKK